MCLLEATFQSCRVAPIAEKTRNRRGSAQIELQQEAMRWRTLAALVAALVGACEALHPDMLVWTTASPTLKGYRAMSQGTPLFMLLS